MLLVLFCYALFGSIRSLPFLLITVIFCNLKNYKGLDGINYLNSLYPGDYNLVNWLNKNIKGQPVILEASGDSYTDYARISANTGLPTVIGWSVHEWLWRGTYDVVSPKIADAQNLYTTQDLNLEKQLLKQYQIRYVVVGDLEVEKYPNLNEENFKKLGRLVFQSGDTKLYQISL